MAAGLMSSSLAFIPASLVPLSIALSTFLQAVLVPGS